MEEVDVSSRQTFCDKVIYYLKNDVFKYTPNVLPLSYNYLYERIVVEEQDIMTLLEYGGNEHEI